MGLLKAINSYRKKLKKQIQNAHQEKPKPVNRERAPNTKKMQKESAVRASKQAQSHQTSSGASKGVKQQQRKNVENTAGGRAYAGAVSSVFTLGMAQPQSKKVRESKEYKAGRIAGDFLTYGTGYGAVGKALAKKTAKTVAKHAAENVVKETAKKGAEEAVKKTATKAALKTAESETRKALEKTIAKEGLENVSEKNITKSLSENAAEKLAKTRLVKSSAKRELAKKGIKDASEAQIKREAVTKADKLVSKVAQNVITDATVGTALDTAHAKGEGIKIGSKDYAKYMAQNAAMNVGFGVGAEAIGAGAKALKNNNKVLALVKQADGSWKKKLVEKDKYHFVDTPKQGKVAIEKHADNTFKDASNKRKAMREGNKEFKEAHGDMMRGKGSEERNFESLAMRRKLQTSNQDVLKAPELTPNRAWRDTKANYEKMGVKPPKSKGEASIEKLQELVEQPTERPKKYNQKAQRLVQDGEVAPKVQKKALDRFMADRDFDPKRAKKLLKTGEATTGNKRIGYHAGDLGKAEFHHNQAGGGRHTGAFGTGTYFAGNKDLLKGGGYGSRPLHEINYENYNLYRPKDTAQGIQVHDDLRALNRESLNLGKLSKKMNTGDKEIENMRNAFNESSDAYTQKNLARMEEIADDVLSKSELDDIKRKADDAFAETNGVMSREEAEELAKEEADRFRKEMSEFDMDMSEEEYESYIKERVDIFTTRPTISKEEYYYNYLVDALDKEVNGDFDGASKYLDDIKKSKELIPRLAKNLGKSEDEVRKAFDETVDTVSKYGDLSPKKKLDSASTVLMKKLGFDGVDVTGIKGLDNTEYGSVIYDLKPEAPKAETSSLKDALNDEGFVKHIKDDNVNIQKYAEDNNMSLPEATKKLHREYVDNVQTLAKENSNEVTKGYGTIRGSEIQTKESLKNWDETMKEGALNKRYESHEEALSKARSAIDTDGVDDTAKIFNAKVEDGYRILQEDIAKGYLCADHFIKNGDMEKANQVLVNIAAAESEAGRTLQAMRLMRSMTPTGKVQAVVRNIEKLGKERGVDIDLPDELLTALRNAKTEKEIYEAQKAISKHVWDQIPANWVEKMNAWRYLAMLGNPKTHVRNFLGNVMFIPARKMRNALATGLEKALVKEGNRTKAIITRATDKELIDAGAESWDEVGDILRNSSGKYLDNAGNLSFKVRDRDARVFKTGWLNKLYNMNGNALDKEDLWFMKPAYINAYASYLKANKIDLRTASKEVLDKARDYASEEALKNTYRDFSVLAEKIQKVKRYANMKTKDIPTSADLTPSQQRTEQLLKKGGGIAVEALAPFTKTPINIMRRGWDYSPAGLMQGMINIARAKGNQDMLVSAIEKVASGITGSSLMLIGAYMGSKGLANGSMDFQSKSDNYDKALGQQQYSVTLGDHTYTMDWAAPLSMPFFVGVEAGSGIDPSEVMNAPTKLLEPVLNLSMLSSLNSALDTQFATGNPISTVAKQTMEGYVGQYLPTVGAQIARTIQPETTTTTATDKSTALRGAKREINSLKNKVPFLSDTNAVKVNVWGETEKKNTGKDYAKSALQNLLSPTSVKQLGESPVDKELKRLKAKGADDAILPNMKPTSYTFPIGKEEINVTPYEYSQMQITAGKTAKKRLEKLFDSNEYQNMALDEKEKAISGIYTDAKKRAKVEMFRNRGISDTSIAWETDLSSQQREKFGNKKNFKKTLKSIGLSPKDFMDLRSKGMTLANMTDANAYGVDINDYAKNNHGLTVKQYSVAKEHNISTKQYAKVIKARDKYDGYGARALALVEKGLLKSPDEAEVYDIKTTTLKKAIDLYNSGYTAKEIGKIEGNSEDAVAEIKSYGVDSRGWYTKEALYKWIETEHGNDSQERKRLLWKLHGYGTPQYQNANPY